MTEKQTAILNAKKKSLYLELLNLEPEDYTENDTNLLYQLSKEPCVQAALEASILKDKAKQRIVTT